MKRASKAALLSGLVFPGVGHMVLRQYLRGSVLMLAALVATSIIIRGIFQRALSIIDRVNSGEIPADAGAIAEAVASSSGAANNLAENTAMILLVAFWLIGIIDSYRLGAAEDSQT